MISTALGDFPNLSERIHHVFYVHVHAYRPKLDEKGSVKNTENLNDLHKRYKNAYAIYYIEYLDMIWGTNLD